MIRLQIGIQSARQETDTELGPDKALKNIIYGRSGTRSYKITSATGAEGHGQP